MSPRKRGKGRRRADVRRGAAKDVGQVELLPDLAPPPPDSRGDAQGSDVDEVGAASSHETEARRPGPDARQTSRPDPGTRSPGTEQSAAAVDGPAAGDRTGTPGSSRPGAPLRPPAAGQTSASAKSTTSAAAPSTSAAAEGRRDPAGRTAPSAGGTPRPQGNQLARARELVEAGRIEDAIAQYRTVLAENPDNLKAHNNLGVLFDELGQRTTALEHFEEAIRVEPENVEVLTNYGSALTSLQRFDAADAVLRRALRVAPDDVAAHLALGILLFRRGLYTQAEAELKGVCDRDGANGGAFYYRAEALNRVGRFDEATEVMMRAAELLPGDPRPFYTLGHLYDRQQRPAEAAEMYRRARDLQGP